MRWIAFFTFVVIVMVVMAKLVVWGLKPSKRKSQQLYQKPQLKPLTKEQIEAIHAKGKITPAEKVKEWENKGLCAPGDARGCEKFKTCHDCLVDYINGLGEEFTPFETTLKEVARRNEHEDANHFL